MSDGLYNRVAGLPLELESTTLERLEQPITSGFTRVTTVIRLRGRGAEGVGEDVTYEGVQHDELQAEGLGRELEGTHTLDSFSELLEGISDYRRWGFESAALDLALRQAGRSLAEALDREARPVTFVVSMRLGDPPTIEPLRRWLDHYPGLRFKLDPTSGWDEPLVEELARTGAVVSVDLKGAYRGTPVDQPADPVLYRRVAELLPDAWIEDPALTPATEPVLRPHRDRITWDAPIHSLADIEALPFPPRMLNFKPSRFGSVHRLFEAYDYCAANGIGMYGGGQFELGPGRGQIQYLASILHADAPNDVAPSGFNVGEPRPGLPTSPLAPRPARTGFRWEESD